MAVCSQAALISKPSSLECNTEAFGVAPSRVKFSTASSPLRKTGSRKLVVSSLRSTGVAEPSVAAPASASTPVTLNARVIIKRKPAKKLGDIFRKGLDFFLADPLGQDILLQLVSTEAEPGTGYGKKSREVSLQRIATKQDVVEYSADFTIDKEFGVPGAIVISNRHKEEFFLETISLQGPDGPVHFSCYSWVHSQEDDLSRRVFFYNEAALPCNTPEGLREIRKLELQALRGNGKGVRKYWERIYDYDVYNDLGDPDKDLKLARPAAGSKSIPYPRRCRTGRPPSKSDVSSESRLPYPLTQKNYVPRDEDFEQIKSEAFSSGRLRAIVHRFFPSILTQYTDTPDEFDTLSDIDQLFYEGIRVLADVVNDQESLWSVVPEPVKKFAGINGFISAVKYPPPPALEKDRYAWTRDSEFGRQFLAGLNPMKIERLKVFPPSSTLDPSLYGPQASAFKASELEKHLEGLCLEEAMNSGKLFIADYHDMYLPLLNKINSLKGRKTYATRTILFLDSSGQLRPVGIELSLPVSKSKPNGSTRAFYPSDHATKFWLWQLAKTHVRSNESSYHQVVSHWLQTHACIEPYSIASNRQLSAMHPVYKLIDPHLRYTMQINASARQTLINSDGIIEQCFTPGQYVLELSAAGYKNWRFDQQSLPADLLARGMAVEDECSPHGVRLLIEDYPYAADGLLIWSALKSWVSTYVNTFYDSPEAIQSDAELQGWWSEIKSKGHPEKQDGWPSLGTPGDLAEILSSIMWVASGHHAAVNFGQFMYSGYVLNLPSLTRRLIPEEHEAEYKRLVHNPQEFLLATLPNQVQATKVMAVLELLSAHHPDEEYLGQRVQRHWIGDEGVLQAAKEFEEKLSEIEKIIMKRNNDPELLHRNGAGIPPYQLLMPHSGPGLTARGVPNSVSI